MISLENVSKKFGTGTFGVSDITLGIDKGEFVFLVGPTGSGKTTIFRLLIREILPTQGTIVVNSWDIVKLPNKKVADLRKKIGVIFQDLKLLSDRTILENTTLPLDIAGVKPDEAIRRAKEALERVEIIEHMDKFPVQLSGGEVQRAAIARALILSPEIILADEPTGNLDDQSSWEIVKFLSEINEAGTTVIMATHSAGIVRKLDKRIVELDMGKIVNDKKGKQTKAKTEDRQDKDIKESKEKKSKDEKHATTETPADAASFAEVATKAEKAMAGKQKKTEAHGSDESERSGEKPIDEEAERKSITQDFESALKE